MTQQVITVLMEDKTLVEKAELYEFLNNHNFLYQYGQIDYIKNKEENKK